MCCAVQYCGERDESWCCGGFWLDVCGSVCQRGRHLTHMLLCFYFPSPSQEVLLHMLYFLHSRRHALSETSLQRPSNHLTCVCVHVNASSIGVTVCVCVCLFWWRLVPSSFITGLSQRDHSCFCLIFLLFSPPFCLISTLNLLMSVRGVCSCT